LCSQVVCKRFIYKMGGGVIVFMFVCVFVCVTASKTIAIKCISHYSILFSLFL